MAPKRNSGAAVPSSSATAGKKRKGGATAAAAVDPSAALKKTSGDWVKSSVTEKKLVALQKEGLQPPADKLAVRAPSNREILPEPRSGERVCFAEFLPRGFALPLHDFVRGLLYAYGVQIHDLTPNSILHIACFMVMCECFLGVSPSWALWKSIFQVRHMCRDGRVNPVGGIGFQVRGDCKYFNLKAAESAQGWRAKWFYVPVDQDVRPGFSTGTTPVKTKAWEHTLSTEEKKEVAALLNKVNHLLNTVRGVQLISTFVKHRVWPLQQRAHPMLQYEGTHDATRMSDVELLPNELDSHVKSITSHKADEVIDYDFSTAPYDMTNALPEGHSTVTSLPPLPEAGPAEEATVLDEGKKPADFLPAANSSFSDGTEVEEESEGQKDGESALAPVLKRHRVLRQEASSSHSGGDGREELGNSGTSSPVKNASPLAQRSPPPATGLIDFGGPSFNVDPSSDKDEHSTSAEQVHAPPTAEETIMVSPRAEIVATALVVAATTAGSTPPAAAGPSTSTTFSWTEHPAVSGLVAAGKAFVQSEEERVALRSRLEELSRDKTAIEKRLADAEKSLAAQQLHMEKELGEARNSAAIREEERAKRLLSFMHAMESSSSSALDDAASDNLSLDRVIGQLGAAIQHAKGSLDTSTQTLGAVFKEVLPSSEVPSTAQGFAHMLGPGSTTMRAFARSLTVRGLESTLQLLLANDVSIDYERALSDIPKKPDGKPLPLKRVAERAAQLSKVCIHTMERRVAPGGFKSKSRGDRSESVSRS